jgi:DNA-directed RNA polymerase subunit RPC12/RpoP
MSAHPADNYERTGPLRVCPCCGKAIDTRLDVGYACDECSDRVWFHARGVEERQRSEQTSGSPLISGADPETSGLSNSSRAESPKSAALTSDPKVDRSICVCFHAPEQHGANGCTMCNCTHAYPVDAQACLHSPEYSSSYVCDSSEPASPSNERKLLNG